MIMYDYVKFSLAKGILKCWYPNSWMIYSETIYIDDLGVRLFEGAPIYISAMSTSFYILSYSTFDRHNAHNLSIYVV